MKQGAPEKIEPARHRRKVSPIGWVMCILALILSVIAFWAIFLLAECEFISFYEFLPPALRPRVTGPESGLIAALFYFLVAVVAAPLALLFAFIHFRRDRTRGSSRLLLLWCWLLIFAFMVTLVKAYYDYKAGT